MARKGKEVPIGHVGESTEAISMGKPRCGRRIRTLSASMARVSAEREPGLRKRTYTQLCTWSS